MKKYFAFLMIALLLLVASVTLASDTGRQDTGPPGCEVVLEDFSADIIAVSVDLCITGYLYEGLFVVDPGDKVVSGYNAVTLNADYAFIYTQDYNNHYGYSLLSRYYIWQNNPLSFDSVTHPFEYRDPGWRA